MKIVDVKAPTSFRVPKENQVSLGIGTMTKRDCVMVKVTTEDGIVGWGGPSARAPGRIGHLVNTTLKARGRHGCDRHGGHLGADLQVPARQPWRGRRHGDGDERARPGPLGHQG